MNFKCLLYFLIFFISISIFGEPKDNSLDAEIQIPDIHYERYMDTKGLCIKFILKNNGKAPIKLALTKTDYIPFKFEIFTQGKKIQLVDFRFVAENTFQIRDFCSKILNPGESYISDIPFENFGVVDNGDHDVTISLVSTSGNFILKGYYTVPFELCVNNEERVLAKVVPSWPKDYWIGKIESNTVKFTVHEWKKKE